MRNEYICGYGRRHRLFGQWRHISLAAYDNRERPAKFDHHRQYLSLILDQCLDLGRTLVAIGRSIFARKVLHMRTLKLSRYYSGTASSTNMMFSENGTNVVERDE